MNKSSKGKKRIQILVVDDSPLALQTTCSFLETQPTIEIVGTARDGRQALEQVETLRPDLVLMDIQMPEMNGLEATRQLRSHSPGTRVILVTSHDTQEARSAALASGAHGFVPKDRLHKELAAEIRRFFPDG